MYTVGTLIKNLSSIKKIVDLPPFLQAAFKSYRRTLKNSSDANKIVSNADSFHENKRTLIQCHDRNVEIFYRRFQKITNESLAGTYNISIWRVRRIEDKYCKMIEEYAEQFKEA